MALVACLFRLFSSSFPLVGRKEGTKHL
ncbi:competence protein ComK, partial [Listeria monocytogenes]|nr:competence protein ComK [Listeria monocytogenes]